MIGKLLQKYLSWSLFFMTTQKEKICLKRKLHADFLDASTFYLCLFSTNQIRLCIKSLFVFPSFYHVSYLPVDLNLKQQITSWKIEKYSLKNYIRRLHFLSNQHHYIVLHQVIYVRSIWGDLADLFFFENETVQNHTSHLFLKLFLKSSQIIETTHFGLRSLCFKYLPNSCINEEQSVFNSEP